MADMIVPNNKVWERVRRLELEKAKLWWVYWCTWAYGSALLHIFTGEEWLIGACGVAFVFTIIAFVNLLDVRNVHGE